MTKYILDKRNELVYLQNLEDYETILKRLTKPMPVYASIGTACHAWHTKEKQEIGTNPLSCLFSRLTLD